MHTYEEYRQILELWDRVKNKKRIANITGINRSTVRECIVRYGTVEGIVAYKELNPDSPKNLSLLKSGDYIENEALFAAYSYLLAAYLGDGYIARHPRAYRLRIACDTNYPAIIETMTRTMQIVTPDNLINTVQHGDNCVEVSSYNTFWPDFFPQYGDGRKHERSIILETWQSHIIDTYPREFIKGLIHTDGCRDRNPVKGKEYPRYQFNNKSDDIKGLFCRTCDLLQLHWTLASNGLLVQIARRADVAYLDQFIGPKS